MTPIVETYESLDAALRVAETRPRPVFDSSRTNSESFCGTRNFEEACQLARFGWTKGTAMAETVRASIQHQLEAQITTRQTFEWDVAGSDVDMGRYIDGEPENMLTFAEEVADGNKFVRITVTLSASAGVSKDEMTRKGVAVLALVDALENHGTRCEVDVVAAFSLMSGKAPIYTASIRIKNAQDSVEPDRLAFALAHPSMFRRIAFSLMEGLPKEYLHALGCCYGRPADAKPSEGIYVGPMQLWNDSQAADWVISQLKSVGVAVKEEL
jgi:hypothetical protein